MPFVDGAMVVIGVTSRKASFTCRGRNEVSPCDDSDTLIVLRVETQHCPMVEHASELIPVAAENSFGRFRRGQLFE